LYAKVNDRCKEIDRARDSGEPGWQARRRNRARFRQEFGKELDELETYARDLRSTIVRLRRRPIRRCKAWIHVMSARFAMAGALACYLLALTGLLAFCYFADAPLWALGARIRLDTVLLLQAIGGPMLLANWLAVSLAALAIPLLYVIRRSTSYRQRGPEVRRLREFAATDPERLTHEGEGEGQGNEKTTEDAPPTVPAMIEQRKWFDVLGVSPWAVAEDVKQAYRVLVKQNHPDRVQSMSAVFRELAEAETKKLNAAYAEALAHFQVHEFAGEDAGADL
jgi:hypothetical protein